MALIFLAFNVGAGEISIDAKPQIAPPSGWVKPHFFNRSSNSQDLDPSAAQRWLLIERQINVSSNQTFVHCVRQMLNASGVQEGSTLKIDFNPEYQNLTLHWVRLWRGTNYLNRLDEGKVRVVRQERGLGEDLLNGEQTAVLVLEDVRAGDILDYAYSLTGINPVFEGHFSTSVSVQLSEPVDRLFTRIFWPIQRSIYTTPHNCTVQPMITSDKDSIEYVWDLKQVPAFHEEDSLPVWFDAVPWVQLSEFKTWADVNQWALALFQNTSPLSPELIQKVGEWRRLENQEQRALAALRFVQDEVRYFGIELGMNSHKPADAATVFSRRFGDCKDKSLLFATLLRNLGIEAYPVLVNTDSRRSIEAWWPTADAFDHCIAVVQLDGRAYWVDPTASFQRGSLGMHYLPDYGRGLVISPRTTALGIIPQTAGLPRTVTTEYFSLGGKNTSSTLKVVTVAEGRDADALRATLAGTKRVDLEKFYVHFYSDLYPSIRMTAPVVVEDDQSQNRLQTTEFYTIDNIWTRSDTDGKYRCSFYPYAIASLIKKPVDVRRRLPLGIGFPQHQILRTEITLPVSWPFERENKLVQDPAFTFRKQARNNGRTLFIEYEYQSLADAVPADRTADFLQKQSEVSKTFGNSFIWK